jgi:tetratricopeptide (TPR) repeat protein
MPLVRILLLIAAVLAQVPIVRADAVDECNSLGDIRKQLDGCTAYIATGSASAQNLATAYVNRANIYAQQHQALLAIDDYVAAMVLDPSNPLIPYNRGNLYFDMRRYDLAIADYSRAIELDPSLGFAFLNRGLAHAKQGDTRAAAADYGRARQRDATILDRWQRAKQRTR